MQSMAVTKRGASRVRAGHLWIYRSDVIDRGDAEGGSIVTVRDQHGNFVGQALFSDASEISLRLLTQSDEPIDRRVVAQANSRRRGTAEEDRLENGCLSPGLFGR